MLAKSHNKQRVNFFAKQASWLILAAIMFLAGYKIATYSRDADDQQIAMLSQSSANLVEENQTLTEKYNQQKIALDISQISLDDTKKMLAEALDREAELKQQIMFYQRVMVPEADTDGFLVEHAEVSKMQGENAFVLSLVLLQNRNIKDTLTGKLNIRLVGMTDGKFESYSLAEISEESQAFDYAFRYFQLKDIPFVIPQTFIPEKFEISTDVYKFKRKRGSYFKTLNWSEVSAEAENT